MVIDILFVSLLFCCLLLTVVPTVPGLLFMFLATLAYGVVDGFETFTARHLVVFAALTILSLFVDYFSGLIGAKLGGASKKALLLGVIGMLIGLVAFPPLGAFVGLFVGVFVAELLQYNDHLKALKAASFSLVGAATGSIVNVLLAVVYFVFFLFVIF